MVDQEAVEAVGWVFAVAAEVDIGLETGCIKAGQGVGEEQLAEDHNSVAAKAHCGTFP